MPKNNDPLYFGKECEHRVFYELLKLKYDVYSTIVDSHGIDCIIKKRGSKKYFFIQIKGRKPRWKFSIGKVDKDVDYFILIPPDTKIYCVPSKIIKGWLDVYGNFNFDTKDKRKIRDKYLGIEQIK